jgi:ketosteroid isomerase-like protein
MNDQNADVQSFFTGYETANATFDVEQIAACYADVFLFGGPAGVQCVKKEDFQTMLPRRKEFFRSRGLVSSKIDSLDISALDSKYTLVKVLWNMSFERGGESVASQNAASYILSITDDRYQIVFQIDHQDLGKRVQELGLE